MIGDFDAPSERIGDATAPEIVRVLLVGAVLGAMLWALVAWAIASVI